MKKQSLIAMLALIFCVSCIAAAPKKEQRVAVYGPNKFHEMLKLNVSDCAIAYKADRVTDTGFISLLSYDGKFFDLPGFPLNLAYPSDFENYESWEFNGISYSKVSSRELTIDRKKINAFLFKKNTDDQEGMFKYFYLSKIYGLVAVAYEQEDPMVIDDLSAAINPDERALLICEKIRQENKSQ